MWNLIKKEGKEILYNKKIWIIFFMVSIIFIIGTYCNTKEETSQHKINVGLVDLDNSMYSNLLTRYFVENDAFSSYVQIEQGSLDKIEEDFLKYQLDAYLVIPENFAENLIQIQNTPMDAKIHQRDTTTALLIQNVLEGYEKYIAAVQINTVGLSQIMENGGISSDIIEKKNTKISIDLVLTALGRNDFFEYQEHKTLSATPIIEYYGYAICILLVMYSSLYIGLLFLAERKSQMFQRGKLAGITLWNYGLAKLFVHGSILSLILSSGYLIINWNYVPKDQRFHTYLDWFVSDGIKKVCYIVAIVLFFILLSMILSCFFNDKNHFLIAGNMIYFVLAILGGAVIPFLYLPENIAFLGKWTPVYWFIYGMSVG